MKNIKITKTILLVIMDYVISNCLKNCEKEEVLHLIENKGYDPLISIDKNFSSIDNLPLKILESRFFNPNDIIFFFKILGSSYSKTPYNSNVKVMKEIKNLLIRQLEEYKLIIIKDFHSYIFNYEILLEILKCLKINVFEGINRNNLTCSLKYTLIQMIFNYWSKVNYRNFLEILKISIQVYNYSNSENINYVKKHFNNIHRKKKSSS